jgi:uncharacterized protein (DUF305 family)
MGSTIETVNQGERCMPHIPTNPRLALAGILTVVVSIIGGGQIAAHHNPQSMTQHEMPSPTQAAGPADEAYHDAMQRMHDDMAMAFTGDPDVDFARGMIPHHQGAIDMAKAVLEYGQDPQIKKLAVDIIAAQEKEIEFLRDWLQRKGKAPG